MTTPKFELLGNLPGLVSFVTGGADGSVRMGVCCCKGSCSGNHLTFGMRPGLALSQMSSAPGPDRLCWSDKHQTYIAVLIDGSEAVVVSEDGRKLYRLQAPLPQRGAPFDRCRRLVVVNEEPLQLTGIFYRCQPLGSGVLHAHLYAAVELSEKGTEVLHEREVTNQDPAPFEYLAVEDGITYLCSVAHNGASRIGRHDALVSIDGGLPADSMPTFLQSTGPIEAEGRRRLATVRCTRTRSEVVYSLWLLNGTRWEQYADLGALQSSGDRISFSTAEALGSVPRFTRDVAWFYINMGLYLGLANTKEGTMSFGRFSV